MNNAETPGTVTIKYKHTANRSNIKYRGWGADGLKEFSEIAKLLKDQRSEQYRQQIKEMSKINSIVSMALLHLHQVKEQISTLHIKTYQVMRMHLYQQNKTNQLMQILTLSNQIIINVSG